MYCKSLTNYYRFKIESFNIGSVPVGSSYPVRIQTMTNTLTQDVDATTKQIIRCIKKGSDLVRVTTPTLKDVEALKEIQNTLQKLNFNQPLIADIHFNPKVATAASQITEKIRINPGNFVNSSIFKESGYSAELYNKELQTITNICKPLLDNCKKHKTSIRR